MTNYTQRDISKQFYSYKMQEIASDILDRCDGDTMDDLLQAIDDGLIYTADQWAIIEYYSTPDEPLPFADAVMQFVDDIMIILEA